ncbi:MAG: deaminase [Candidatus Taylorbacteria bacterium]|nr:deaminase [Candidatus Taylorbacteria bacterium]
MSPAKVMNVQKAMPESKTAVVAFVPVIHKGYVDFFNAHPGDIWIFGTSLIKQYVHLTRDLRTIDPNQALFALKAIFPDRKISVLEQFELNNWKYDMTIMPEDEVCEDLAAKNLSGKKFKFVKTFLRWNRVITFKENEIDPKRHITRANFDREVMAEAFRETEKSADWWRQVAAVAVKDGKVLIKAHNHHMPTDFHLAVNGDPRSNFDAGQHGDIYTSIHAEAEVIASAAEKGLSLKGASLYSTTFPCPNCARLIAQAGIKKVFYSKGYSVLDAERILEHFGVEIVMVQ